MFNVRGLELARRKATVIREHISLLRILLDSKLYRQIVGIPMGKNCAPLIADLCLFCYKKDFIVSHSEENQSEVIEAFNSTSRYLDVLLNIDIL